MWYFDPTVMLLIPAMIFAFYAQGRVRSAYRKYASVRNRRGITGAQAARMILDNNGLRDVRIEMVNGTLSDHYDPRTRVMRLSPRVYNEPSIASVSIAAHESGHAIQHAELYVPLKLRNGIVPIANVASMLSWPLMIIGILVANAGNYAKGNLIMDIGILFFASVVLFHAVTLPVEFNASSRAVKQLEHLGIVYEEERSGARRVLSAAAMTYVAALATAVANLLRLLVLRERNQ
ncbi:zinc metallopeptidase [Aminipila luticellarii]|uniref:Zinc metallopeptidase n=1 Tax=Aminipila luticellarii TaxID=2507160 RepID=A0A410PW73_9FIRM|nr:zinc metallopeptidase [Aminipila luticellarii]QAT43192.1 zinc metallopeptidase [Aminipila luticellarii]